MFDRQVSSQRFCWLCGKIISLEQCKVDEKGLPVHEDCYVAKVKMNANDPSLRSSNGRFASKRRGSLRA